jgi:hypothetical protein
MYSEKPDYVNYPTQALDMMRLAKASPLMLELAYEIIIQYKVFVKEELESIVAQLAIVSNQAPLSLY